MNLRGVHWIDSSGKDDLKLSEVYRVQAEDVENEGFHRIAILMRELTDFYKSEAQRNIRSHNLERTEYIS